MDRVSGKGFFIFLVAHNTITTMITDDKIKEARKLLSRGVPKGEIKEMLAREGYSKGDIDKVFATRPYDMRSWYLFFGIVLG